MAVRKWFWMGAIVLAFTLGFALENEPGQAPVSVRGAGSEEAIRITGTPAAFQGSWSAGVARVFAGSLEQSPRTVSVARCTKPRDEGMSPSTSTKGKRATSKSALQVDSCTSFQEDRREARSALLLLIMAHLASSSNPGAL